MADAGNPRTKLGSAQAFENRYIRLTLDQVSRSGLEHPYTGVRFKVLGVAALPIDRGGQTFLVGQYRDLLDRATWELPRGGGSLDVPPLDTARRELREETGFDAAEWLALPTLTRAVGQADP